MSDRRRWRGQEAEVRYCSRACRARGIRRVDKALEDAIRKLVAQRGETKTICPSEAARIVAGEDGWRALMEDTRRAARRLTHAGETEILQGGRIVDPGTFRGPIRIRAAKTRRQPEA